MSQINQLKLSIGLSSLFVLNGLLSASALAPEKENIEATGSITPNVYSDQIFVGETISLERDILLNVEDIVHTLTTSSEPEKLDVLFLADNTDSMGDAIANVQDNAQELLTALANTYGDVQIGVARYYGDPQEKYSSWESRGNKITFNRTYTFQKKTSCTTSQGETYSCYQYLINQSTSEGDSSTWKSKLPLAKYKQYGSSHTSTWKGYRKQKNEQELGALGAYELQEAVNGGSFNDAIAAIDNWSAASGRDWSEGNFFALQQAASSGEASSTGYATGLETGWREDAKKIIVWFGDAKSHTNTVSQAEAIAALNAQDISVVAIHTNSTPKSFTDGLDANSQASTIASSTNGQFASVYSSNLAETITALIGTTVETTTTISPGVNLVFANLDNPPGLNITYTCIDPLGCNNVKNNDIRTFRMDITAEVAGSYDFKTIANNVLGAEADNSIDVIQLYAD